MHIRVSPQLLPLQNEGIFWCLRGSVGGWWVSVSCCHWCVEVQAAVSQCLRVPTWAVEGANQGPRATVTKHRDPGPYSNGKVISANRGAEVRWDLGVSPFGRLRGKARPCLCPHCHRGL